MNINVNQQSLRDLVALEYPSLREELRSLKNCQVTFVTFAVTSTGAVLGLGSGTPGLPRAIVFLAPLLVLVPAWLIFFDKATSINRIVGYMRIIEGVLLGQPLKVFYGWENALAEWRERQSELRPVGPFRSRDMTKYHGIVFLTFLLLIATCLALGWGETATSGRVALLWWSLLAAALAVFYLNTRYLYQLSWGKYSSRATYELWRKLLLP